MNRVKTNAAAIDDWEKLYLTVDAVHYKQTVAEQSSFR
jgi:hypothetical protein